MTAMPDGAFFDIAPAGSQRFVIVSLAVETDEPMFGGSAFEEAIYLVKAVGLSTSGADVKTAAARIHALLERGTLEIVGYGLMSMRRVERVRYTEVDEVDRSIRWQHRGGRYEVVVQPT